MDSTSARGQTDSAAWPGSTLLIWGTFGKHTPEGRRYHSRCAWALGLFVVGLILLDILALRWPPAKVALAAIPGVAFGYIAWELRRYVLSLDELARRIQMEAITWTYLTGLVVAMCWGGLSMAYGREWNVGAWVYIFLEPVRGLWLYIVARRY